MTLPDGSPFPVFVRSAAVGDALRCRIVKVLRRYAAAIPVQILTPSPDRVDPDCAGAGKCGGCAFRHISYEAELQYKTDAVKRLWRLNGPKDVTVEDCVPSPEICGYRNKLQLPLSPDGRFGFYAGKTHRVVPVSACPAGHPALWNAVEQTEAWIREYGVAPYDETSGSGAVRHLFLRRGYHSGQIMACLVLNGIDRSLPLNAWAERMQSAGVCSVWLNENRKNTNVIFGDRWERLAGASAIEDTMNGVTFRISAPSFYQINTAQAERIYRAAADCLSPDDDLLDLYCGIGTVGLCCASRVRRVMGIEVISQAVEDAAQNARANGISNASFFAADAAQAGRILAERSFNPTAVVVDPPRKGLSPDTVKLLLDLAPEKIVYISCDPATQARDAALLSPSYSCGPVRPYDMFPRTGHVESVVRLIRQ